MPARVWSRTARLKYRNRPMKTEDGYFASQAEYRRWQLLKLLAQNGDIQNLKRQVAWPLVVNGCRVANYRVDFQYQDRQGQVVLEDVKGMRAGGAYALFTLKRRLLEATTGMQVREVN